RDRAVSQVAVAVGILELDARDGARRVVAEVAVGEGARRGDDHRVAARRDAAGGGAGGVGRVGLRPARLEDLAHEVAAGLQVDAVGAVDGARRGAGHEDRRGGIAALFPYTPLFRSRDRAVSQVAVAVGILELDARDGARR